jgi:hypothetical protein
VIGGKNAGHGAAHVAPHAPDTPSRCRERGVEIRPRRHARSLYWRGWGVTQIADEFALHAVTGDKGKPIARHDRKLETAR